MVYHTQINMEPIEIATETQEEYYLRMEWEQLLEMAPQDYTVRRPYAFKNIKRYLLKELTNKIIKYQIATKYCYMPKDKYESELYIINRLHMWCHQQLLARLGGVKKFNQYIHLYQKKFGYDEAVEYYHIIRNDMIKVYMNSQNDPYSQVYYYLPKKYPEIEKWFIDTIIINLDTAEELKQQNNECPICLNEYYSFQSVITNCNHSFCKECICKHIDTYDKKDIPSCPMCRSDIHRFEIKDIEYFEDLQEKYNTV